MLDEDEDVDENEQDHKSSVGSSRTRAPRTGGSGDDDSEDEEDEMGMGMGMGVRGVLGNSVDVMSMYPSQDPHVSVPEDEFDEDEEDDMTLRADDCMLVVGRSDEDQSSLEFHVYNETDGSFYLHHDILLPAFPLSLAWLDCVPEASDDGAQGHRGSLGGGTGGAGGHGEGAKGSSGGAGGAGGVARSTVMSAVAPC